MHIRNDKKITRAFTFGREGEKVNLDGLFNSRGLRRYRLVMPHEKPHTF